jgi:Flp pilus assembly protein TadD
MWERNSGILLVIIALLAEVLSSSCGSGNPDDETLRLYAKASEAYGSAAFSEAAGLLKKANHFPPALVLQGKAEFFSGDSDAAEKSFRRALELRPGNADAGIYLARLLREKNRQDEAESLVQKILSDDPLDIRALRLASDLAGDKGPAGEAAALGFLNRAAEASIESALVFIDRARLRWIGGNKEGTLEDLERAKGLLPADSPFVRSLKVLESAVNAAGGDALQ